MAKLLDTVLVIDVESTCWENGSPAPGEDSEIIEIGVVPLDVATRQRIDKKSLLIRPKSSHVSEYCTRLTGLTHKQAATEGIPFREACTTLKKRYCSRERAWASWGDYDRRQFQRQCEDFAIPYPFGPTHLNVKNLFALAYALNKEIGMTEALEHLGLPHVGKHHRAADDAWNIANILARFLSTLKSG